MEQPKISVIIIAYKVERFLAQCLTSVINQSYRNLEIILVLGSGDTACEEIGATYANKDSRIVVLSEPPKGVAAARNLGLSAVTGDYIGFVDGDDWIEKDMFETMMDAMQRHRADISVIGKYYAYPGGNEGISENTEYVLNGEEAFEQILYQKGFFLHLWDKLYRREIFDEIHFPEGERIEDRKIGYQLLDKAGTIVYNTVSKYYFRVSEDSGSRVADNLVLSLKNDYEMCDFITAKYPRLKDAAEYFLVYENMSVLQNNILFDTYDRTKDRIYIDYVRKHAENVRKNSKVSKSIQVKMLLCTGFPWLFAKVTIARRKRFLKQHGSYQTGTDWTDTFQQLEKES